MEVTHTEDQDALVSVSEAARIAQLSNDTIRRYADRGLLTVYRTPANHRRFLLREVQALMTQQIAK